MLVRLGHGRAALGDLDLALAAGYPEESRPKLEKRRGECLAAAGREAREEVEVEEEVGERNSLVPAYTSALELRYHPVMPSQGAMTRCAGARAARGGAAPPARRHNPPGGGARGRQAQASVRHHPLRPLPQEVAPQPSSLP